MPAADLRSRLTPPPGLRIHEIVRGGDALLIELRPADTSAAYWAPRAAPWATDSVNWAAYGDTAFVRLVLSALRYENAPTLASRASVWAWVSPYRATYFCWSTRTGHADSLKLIDIKHCVGE
jgi:hypothetical protein